MIMLLCVVIASAQDGPTTAVCQDTHYDCAVYIDEERPSGNEGEVPGIYSQNNNRLAVILPCLRRGNKPSAKQIRCPFPHNAEKKQMLFPSRYATMGQR